MAQITPDEFKRFLHGYNITDCVVREHDLFYFIAREDYTKWPISQWDSENEPPPGEDEVKKIFLGYDGAAPIGKKIGRVVLTGYTRTMAGASTHPDAKGFAISSQGIIYALGGGSKGRETDISSSEDGGPGRGILTRLRTIDGWLYFCGGHNSVGKRLAKNSWFSHSEGVPNPPRADGLDNFLNDIDGFSEQDLYTVGNYGQVFHFDGKAWKRVSLPTNIDLETVCCAGDGQVYISGAKGTTYRGRGNKWQLIHKGGGSLPFRDMVWYEDRIWCTSDYGLWQIKDGKLESATLPDGMNAYSGNLSTAAGVLLLAGYGGAAYLANGVWTKIFSATEMNRTVA
ncbi:hypothetical protein LXA47_05195 [Massilia sp. P8910]|uniref:hypothetical protein n=1 Tax=Massilia antarctica TaxID=2765360 RepID=UPI001E609899|nr:hypothetical protein [Massilia antarctica]MCE3602998.1 hypothetical protein [Massilia antarctica]